MFSKSIVVPSFALDKCKSRRLQASPATGPTKFADAVMCAPSMPRVTNRPISRACGRAREAPQKATPPASAVDSFLAFGCSGDPMSEFEKTRARLLPSWPRACRKKRLPLLHDAAQPGEAGHTYPHGRRPELEPEVRVQTQLLSVRQRLLGARAIGEPSTSRLMRGRARPLRKARTHRSRPPRAMVQPPGLGGSRSPQASLT